MQTTDRTTFAAMTAGFLMIAHQVSGKAVRDSLFLSNYSATDLPKMIIAAGLLSVPMVFIFARLMRRYGPSSLVSAGFFLSSLLHLLEYFLFRSEPRAWSVLIYLHIVSLGSILLSGYWSLRRVELARSEAV